MVTELLGCLGSLTGGWRSCFNICLGGKQTEFYTVLTRVSWVIQDYDRKIITGVQLHYDWSNFPLDVEFLREEPSGWLNYGHYLYNANQKDCRLKAVT